MHEEKVIRQIRDRDEQGVSELLLHYGPLLRYVIAPILPNKQDWEECLSEVTMLVWDKIDAYDPKRGKWTTWLTVLARNAALNRARKREGEMEELSDQIPARGGSPEETFLQRERLAALRAAIDRLAREERLLFYRKYYYQQSTAQIASELGMTQRAVEGRLYRTKKKLRNLLGGDAYDGTGV